MSGRSDPEYRREGSGEEPCGPLEQALAKALNLLAEKERELVEVRRSEERYRSLVEKVMDFVFCVDREGKFTLVNSAVLSLFGYRPEELLGQHFTTILAEESKPAALGHFQRNIRGRGPREVYELEMLSKDGRRVPVEVHGTNVYENGEVVGMRGIARDITERRRAEMQQLHRYNQLRAINQVGQRIVSVLSLDELLPFIADLLRESLGSHNVNVFLRDESGERMVVRASSSDYGPPVRAGTALKIGEQGIIGWVGRSGEPMVVGDVRREPRYYDVPELRFTRSELAVPVKLGDQVVGVLDIESEHLDAFDEVDLWAARTLADQIAVAIRNAELFEAERERREETALILDITRDVGSTLVLDHVLEVAASSIARAVRTPGCGIYLLDETGTRLVPKAGSGNQVPPNVDRAFLSTTLDLSHDRFLREVMETRRPVICANAETDPRTDKDVVKLLHLKSLLAVPFVSRDRVLGIAMVTGFDDFYDFRPEQVELAAGIANSVALAIENARLYERTRDLAVMEERNRLAREIHDTIAQGLTGTVLQLEAADHLMDIDPDRARMRVQKATELARSSLQEARRSVWNLRPRPLEEKTLVEAVRREVDSLAEETAAQVTLEVEGDPEGLPAEAEQGLYRIAQEALTNVRKHARASRVEVRMAFGQSEAMAAVRDDGVGFDPHAARAEGAEGGFGLLGLRERVRLLSGSLRLESSPGCGTLVEVRIPLRR